MARRGTVLTLGQPRQLSASFVLHFTTTPATGIGLETSPWPLDGGGTIRRTPAMRKRGLRAYRAGESRSMAKPQVNSLHRVRVSGK
jgi:hypothetical protein